jgi:CarD family transcriptional regulator
MISKKGCHMFSLNEKVVYPGHGVAIIHRIIEKKIANDTAKFFELRFLHKDMTILVPIANIQGVGIRKLSSNENINTIFSILAQPATSMPTEMITSNWNKRNKEYQGKIRSGDLTEICQIYRDLRHIETYKELSFGEKNLLNQTESLLAEEIALVKDIKEDKAAEQLRMLVTSMRQHMQINVKNS